MDCHNQNNSGVKPIFQEGNENPDNNRNSQMYPFDETEISVDGKKLHVMFLSKYPLDE